MREIRVILFITLFTTAHYVFVVGQSPGSIDESFGDNGEVYKTFDTDNPLETGLSLAPQSDGKILVGMQKGYSQNQTKAAKIVRFFLGPFTNILEYYSDEYILVPNPVRNDLTYCFEGFEKEKHDAYIYDIRGNLIKSVHQFKNLINVQDLQPGVYIFLLRKGNLYLRNKFIKY